MIDKYERGIFQVAYYMLALYNKSSIFSFILLVYNEVSEYWISRRFVVQIVCTVTSHTPAEGKIIIITSGRFWTFFLWKCVLIFVRIASLRRFHRVPIICFNEKWEKKNNLEISYLGLRCWFIGPSYVGSWGNFLLLAIYLPWSCSVDCIWQTDISGRIQNYTEFSEQTRWQFMIYVYISTCLAAF